MNFKSHTAVVLGTLAILACTARQDLGNRAPSDPETERLRRRVGTRDWR